MGVRKLFPPRGDSPPPYGKSPPPYSKPLTPAGKYRHTVYILHPVKTQFPKFCKPELCCVHRNAVTCCGYAPMSWLQTELPGLEYCWNTMELLGRNVPYRYLCHMLEDAAQDVEHARAAEKNLSLRKALLDRFYGLERAKVEEQWDLYTVDMLSDWPNSLCEGEQEKAKREQSEREKAEQERTERERHAVCVLM